MDGSLPEQLAAIVAARSEPKQAAWFANAMAEAGADDAARALPIAFAGAGRRLGRATATLTDSERDALRAAGMTDLPDTWGLDEIGRVALLLRAASQISRRRAGASSPTSMKRASSASSRPCSERSRTCPSRAPTSPSP